MTLEEAIQQQIALGKKDPLEIARAIGKQYDEEWLAAELLVLSEDIVAEIARQRLGAIRRSAPLAVVAGSPKREWRLAPIWIPGEGWKRLADLTVVDLRARQRYYLTISASAARWAQWCLDCIEAIEAQAVETLGQIKGELPAVPEIEEAA